MGVLFLGVTVFVTLPLEHPPSRAAVAAPDSSRQRSFSACDAFDNFGSDRPLPEQTTAPGPPIVPEIVKKAGLTRSISFES